MRKKILFAVIMILLFTLSFVACGRNDESKKTEKEKEEIPVVEEEEEEKEEEPIHDAQDYTTIAVFGIDKTDANWSENSDTIMLVSIDNTTKEVRIASVYRDTILEVSEGKYRKCNSAYAAGGGEQALAMLNKNLDLKIEDYVAIDLQMFERVVDSLGGVEVNVTEAEREACNQSLDSGNKIQKAGEQVLNGTQTAIYARIRKGVGSDYARTERQRAVVSAALEKVKSMNLSAVTALIDEVFPSVTTNLILADVFSYASNVWKYSIKETTGYPIEKASGTIEGIGSSVWAVGFTENVELLHEFLYPNEEYEVSNMVIEIGKKIEEIVK